MPALLRPTLAAVLLLATTADAAPKKPMVTKVGAVVNHTDDLQGKGPCPLHTEMQATVWVSAPTKVEYFWEAADGLKTGRYHAEVAGDGSLPAVKMNLNKDRLAKKNFWYRAHVVAPNERVSKPVHIRWTCE